MGSGSAVPTLRRNPTAQVVNINEHYFLVDCAEGTQMQMRKYEIGLQSINQIFISHLHGDHYLGLPGYLQTLHLLGRTKVMTIFGPQALGKLIMDHFTITNSTPRFPIEFVAVDPKKSELIFEDKIAEVWSIPLKHKIPTSGFLFREKPKRRNLIPSSLKQYKVPTYWMHRLKEGQDFETEDGRIVPNHEFTLPPPRSKSYAFCSDTAYHPEIIDLVKDIDLLYHESSFLEILRQRANETLHSTAADAANIAKQANVRKLLIGHFSARYKDAEPFLEEACAIFPETIAAEDGLVIIV